MARGREIPGLVEVIEKAIKKTPGITAPEVRDICEKKLGFYVSINTVNSAMKRLVKDGELKQVKNGVPFKYYLADEESEVQR